MFFPSLLMQGSSGMGGILPLDQTIGETAIHDWAYASEILSTMGAPPPGSAGAKAAILEMTLGHSLHGPRSWLLLWKSLYPHGS